MEYVLASLRSFLDNDGRLTQMPAKYKKKLTALWYLAEKLEPEREYTEAEINTLLDTWTLFHDPATLRRELYNKRLLNRAADGSSYRKADNIPEFEAFVKSFV